MVCGGGSHVKNIAKPRLGSSVSPILLDVSSNRLTSLRLDLTLRSRLNNKVEAWESWEKMFPNVKELKRNRSQRIILAAFYSGEGR